MDMQMSLEKRRLAGSFTALCRGHRHWRASNHRDRYRRQRHNHGRQR
jgi:hypothetical protein